MRELRQTCTDKMDISQTRFQRLTIFAKIYVLCAGLDSEYISFPLSFKIYDVACFFLLWYKSIHRRCSVKKSVLRKTSVSESPFLTKLQTLACSFIKNETLTQMFSCKFCVTFKNRFFTEHLWWLPLFDGFINPVISGMKRFVNSFIFDTCFNFVYLFICFLFVFCLFLFFFFFDNCKSKICIATEKWTLPCDSEKFCFQCDNNYLCLTRSHYWLRRRRAILQISDFYKTKKVNQ